MSKNNNSKYNRQENFNKKLGLFNWQIREALKRWKSKSDLEDLIGFKLD